MKLVNTLKIKTADHVPRCQVIYGLRGDSEGHRDVCNPKRFPSVFLDRYDSIWRKSLAA